MPGIDECWALPRLLAPHLLEGGGSADEDAEPAGGVRGDVADAPAELSAVQAFLQAHMDSRGLSRQQLQVCLLRHLTKPAQAAALPDAALPQLLRLARQAQPAVQLPAQQALVLGELFADALAASTRAAQQAQPNQPSAARLSVRTRRHDLGMPSVELWQCGMLWITRAKLDGLEEEPSRQASSSAQLQPAHPSAETARVWWAFARLHECAGDAAAATAAYLSCQAVLEACGPAARSVAIELPHCRTDASVSLAAVAAKLEILQLHSLLKHATQQAEAGLHADAAATLAPLLLCCSDKERLLRAQDPHRWQQALQLLLAAAKALDQPLIALRCHLRVLAALLPPVPPQLLSAWAQRGADEGVAAPSASALADLRGALASGVADKFLAHPVAGEALCAAAAFLAGSAPQLPALLAGGAAGDELDAALRPMERRLYRTVQQQLLAVLQACRLALEDLPSDERVSARVSAAIGRVERCSALKRSRRECT